MQIQIERKKKKNLCGLVRGKHFPFSTLNLASAKGHQNGIAPSLGQVPTSKARQEEEWRMASPSPVFMRWGPEG